MPANATGVLIIRAWREDGSARPLRATVRWTTDVSNGMRNEVVLADVDAVCEVVGAWLDDIEAR